MGNQLGFNYHHSLGAQEAKNRIQQGVTKLKQEHAGKFTIQSEQWNDKILLFAGAAMGYSIKGRMELDDATVRLTSENDVPGAIWFLVKGKAEKAIKDQLKAWLS